MLSTHLNPPGCPEKIAVATEVVGIGVNATLGMIAATGMPQSLRGRVGTSRIWIGMRTKYKVLKSCTRGGRAKLRRLSPYPI